MALLITAVRVQRKEVVAFPQVAADVRTPSIKYYYVLILYRSSFAFNFFFS